MPTLGALLIAHGSSRDPAAGRPALRWAEHLRATGRLAEVHHALWREPPDIPTALRSLRAELTVVVPLFMAHGFFTRQILPGQLGFASAEPGATAVLPRTTLLLAPPLGAHPLLPTRAVELAQRALPADEAASTHLIVVGHGTLREPTSGDVARAIVRAAAASGAFAAADATFLEEPPGPGELALASPYTRLLVLPAMAANGGHVRADIPAALGLPPDPPPGPHRVGDRTITLLDALGEAELVGELLLELIERTAAALP